MQPPAVQKGSAALGGRIAFAMHRVEHGRGHHFAAPLQRQRHGIFGDAVNIIRRAIQRIDDPAVTRLGRGRIPAAGASSSLRKSWSETRREPIRRTASCDAKSASVTRSDGPFSRTVNRSTQSSSAAPPARAACSQTARKSGIRLDLKEFGSIVEALAASGDIGPRSASPPVATVADYSRLQPDSRATVAWQGLANTPLPRSQRKAGKNNLPNCWTSALKLVSSGVVDRGMCLILAWRSVRHFEFFRFGIIHPRRLYCVRPLLCSGPAAPRKWTAGFFY